MRARATGARIASSKRLHFETLEPRTMLDGNGLPLSNDAYLTISFANDGVSVAGQSNALTANFNAIAPEGVWQEAILRAFQTWASRTNADIGLVDDGGQAFGSPGASRGDDRFGDIRIAATAMDPTIGAVSVPLDGLVGGTWLGDVVFNTNFPFQSVDDIFAIALHEAGNVFGLEDNNDPASPLHAGTIPTATEPTTADTELLQVLYGVRVGDLNELGGGGNQTLDNDTFANATILELNQYNGGKQGTAPSLAYGDVTTGNDTDVFCVQTPGDFSGPLTIRVHTRGLSLLLPKLTVYDGSQQVVGTAMAQVIGGEELVVTLPTVAADATYYMSVDAAGSGPYSIGGYSLTAIFEGLNQVSSSIVDMYASGSLRKLSQDELSKLFDGDEDNFFNDDEHDDDDEIAATDLASESQFTASNRFEALGSIVDQTDADYYRIKSPDATPGQSDVLIVAIRSLDAGRLIPKLSASDHDLEPVPVTVLSHGGGELVVQVVGIEADRDYYLRVEADNPTGPFHTGNYQLTASFVDAPAVFQSFAADTLAVGTGQNVHTFYVAQPQLFHFLLRVNAAPVNVPTAVVATFRNETGQVVHQFSAAPGQIRSAGAVLLAPGSYTLSISAVALEGVVSLPLDYQVSGVAISDPFASDPNDQTNHPFICPDPGLGGAYCYPGDIITDDPYLWDNFVAARSESPPAGDLTDLIGLLFGDWWSWFWGQSGVNGPPFAASDHYTTPSDSTLDVGTGTGVLANDAEPEGEPVIAVSTSSPRSGQLSFHTDGSFQYVPEPGYNGMVSFTYQASDFAQLSQVGTVSIAVGMIGDYDHNGRVDQQDFAEWSSTFGSTISLDADGNGNGIVDAGDYALWRDNQGQGVSSPIAAGDYDRSGAVDQLDYDVWKLDFGSTTNLDADGSGNGVVDAADFSIWRDHMATSGGAAASNFSSPSTEASVAALTAAKTPISAQAVDTAIGSLNVATPLSVEVGPRRIRAAARPFVVPSYNNQSLLAIANFHKRMQPHGRYDIVTRDVTNFALEDSQNIRHLDRDNILSARDVYFAAFKHHLAGCDRP